MRTRDEIMRMIGDLGMSIRVAKRFRTNTKHLEAIVIILEWVLMEEEEEGTSPEF